MHNGLKYFLMDHSYSYVHHGVLTINLQMLIDVIFRKNVGEQRGMLLQKLFGHIVPIACAPTPHLQYSSEVGQCSLLERTKP